MKLFKNSYERALDEKIARVEMNMSNNYKDAAQVDLAEYEKTLNAYVEEGRLKEKSRKFYEEQLRLYKEKMKGYSHKEQKPYWT